MEYHWPTEEMGKVEALPRGPYYVLRQLLCWKNFVTDDC